MNLMNYYQLLGIVPQSTRQEIIRAYTKKSQFADEKKIQELKRAYLILLDPGERIRYDNQIANQTAVSVHTHANSAEELQIQDVTPTLSVSSLEEMNFYERLDVKETVSSTDIKKAYVKAARTYSNEQYPDHFVLIREAFETLYDADRRAEYDEELDDLYDDEYEQVQPYQHTTREEPKVPSYSPPPQPAYNTQTPTSDSGSSRAVWGWLVAILGSFIFTPFIAIPLGMVIGMGLSGAIEFVLGSLSLIVTIVVVIFILGLIFG